MKTQDSEQPVVSQSILAPALLRLASKPVWGVLMIMLASFILYGFSIWFPLGRDQAIFAYVADRISDGGLPYKDAWDFKSPGIFYIYRLAFALFGKSQMSIRLFDFIIAISTSVIIWHIFYRKGRGTVGVTAGILYGAVYGATGYWNMAQTEGFASFATVLAAHLLLSSKWNRTSRLVPAGLLLGAAFLLKLPFALVGLAFWVWAITSEEKSRRFQTGLILALSALVIPALTAVYFAANGVLGDAVAAVFWFAGKYRNYPPKDLSSVLFDFTGNSLGRRAAFDSLLLPLVVCGFIFASREFSSEHRLTKLWLVATVAAVFLQLKSIPYHWVSVFVPAVVLSGLAFCAVSNTKSSIDNRIARTALMSILVLLVLRALVAGVMLWGFLLTPADSNGSPWMKNFSSDPGQGVSYSTDVAIANHIAENTASDDTVVVFGFEPLINFLADRKSPTRFVYMDAVTAPWTPESWREEYLRDIEKNRPAMVIVAQNDTHIWRTKDSAKMLDEWPELKQFVQENYAPDVQLGSFFVLRLKE